MLHLSSIDTTFNPLTDTFQAIEQEDGSYAFELQSVNGWHWLDFLPEDCLTNDDCHRLLDLCREYNLIRTH